MSARARLIPVPGTEGISELEELGPTTLHLVRRGANGFRPLAAKAKGGQSSLVAACAAVDVVLPAKSLPPELQERPKRRKVAVARLLR
jgi:hypothetical protein